MVAVVVFGLALHELLLANGALQLGELAHLVQMSHQGLLSASKVAALIETGLEKEGAVLKVVFSLLQGENLRTPLVDTLHFLGEQELFYDSIERVQLEFDSAVGTSVVSRFPFLSTASAKWLLALMAFNRAFDHIITDRTN